MFAMLSHSCAQISSWDHAKGSGKAGPKRDNQDYMRKGSLCRITEAYDPSAGFGTKPSPLKMKFVRQGVPCLLRRHVYVALKQGPRLVNRDTGTPRRHAGKAHWKDFMGSCEFCSQTSCGALIEGLTSVSGPVWYTGSFDQSTRFPFLLRLEAWVLHRIPQVCLFLLAFSMDPLRACLSV